MNKLFYGLLLSALLYPTIGQSQNISFADSQVKAICVANWDSNGDGELSKTEAAAVTTLNKVFKDNTSITSFDELKNFTKVTSLASQEFYGCTNLTEITLPSKTKTIGAYAFQNCKSLTSIDIPSTVTSISKNPFRGCENLTSITVNSANTYFDARDDCNAIIQKSNNALISGCKTTILPTSVKRINDYAFDGITSLTEVNVPEGVTRIGEYAFARNPNLKRFYVPSTVTNFGNYALANTPGLETIIVSENNTNYDSRNNCNAVIETAFNYLVCGCKTTVIPNTITWIARGAFFFCTSLTNIDIPSSVKRIDNEAFEGCSNLPKIIIPEGIEQLDEYAFSNCKKLKNVVIPSTVTTIDWYLFYNTENITDVYSKISNPTAIYVTTFPDWVFEHATLHVPTGTKQRYTALTGWQKFANIVEETAPGSVLNDYAMGDVNNDGSTSVNDVMGIVDYVLGNSSEDINVAYADVNNDGEVTITDIMSLVDKILMR